MNRGQGSEVRNQSLKQSLGRAVLEGAYRAVFPNKCLFCKRVLDGLREICCGGCEDALAGKIFESGLDDAFGVYAAFDYGDGAVSGVIARFKYQGKRLLARPMAAAIFRRFGNLPADFLICVPAHENRVRERGYNQAALLAEELGRLMGLAAYDALARRRDTAKQFDLNLEERDANVAGAFALREDFCVAGKHVILVDDVLTTGATAAECAKVLMGAGAKSVEIMAFAAATLTQAL